MPNRFCRERHFFRYYAGGYPRHFEGDRKWQQFGEHELGDGKIAKARVRSLSDGLDDLLRSDWVEVIDQAALGEEDTYIATRYLLDGIPQIEIAEELGDQFEKSYNRSTISRRMPKIIRKIERAAIKMGKIT